MSTTPLSKLKRPMAKVRHVGLFSREIVERPCLAGIEMLLERSSKLSEGQVVDQSRTGQSRYFGSTMLTVDLRDVQGQVRDSCDVATAMRLARLWANDDLVLCRVRSIAHAEAERHAGCVLRRGEIDVRLRAEGSWVFIDTDIEADVERRIAETAPENVIAIAAGARS